MTDPNVDAVIAKLREREALGLRKYGVSTYDAKLSLKDWATHAQEEALDFAVYLEAIIRSE